MEVRKDRERLGDAPVAGMTEKPRLLLVDDEEAFLHDATAFLRQEGYECASARETALAADLLRDGEYDAVIANASVSGNIAAALTQDLWRLAAGAPIILVTNTPSLQAALQALRLQAVAYLIKPVTFPELLEHVGAAAERGRLRRTIVSLQQRLQGWRQDLETLSQALRLAPEVSSTTASDALSQLTLGNVTGALAELLRLRRTDGPSPLHPSPRILAPLSSREREILLGLLTYHRVSVLARTLRLSPHTVRNHLKSIFRKCGVHSQAELLELLRE